MGKQVRKAIKTGGDEIIIAFRCKSAGKRVRKAIKTGGSKKFIAFRHGAGHSM